MGAVRLANSYTDTHGVWPMLVVMALSAALLLRNAPAARFVVRHITGPKRGMPQHERFSRFNDSSAWLLYVRAILGLWAAGIFVISLLAVLGWLPEE